MKQTLSGAVLAFWILSTAARCCVAEAVAGLPRFFTADYSLYSTGSRVAAMTRTFSILPQGGYRYRSETRPVGLLALIRRDIITESSEWQFDGREIKPDFYSYRHAGGKQDRNVEILFNWEDELITTTVNGSSWRMQMQPRITDKLLYQLSIMRDLARGMKNISYMVADGGKLKQYDFVTLGQELVQTPMGDFQALKLERFKPGSERSTVLWCAPNLDYLPIKVETIEPDGATTIAVLESLSVSPAD